MIDLSLVSETDLLNELKKRYEAMVFAGSKNVRESVLGISLAYNGSSMACIGLAEYARLTVFDRELGECNAKEWIE